MAASPLVSIVMPTYNRAHVLASTIESILNQSFDSFELLVIDDGSGDDTENLIGKLCQKDNRLRYIRLPQNRGVGFARNAGLRYAQGIYLAFADSDDPWLPGRLQKQIEILEAHPEIDILFGDYLNFDHLQNLTTKGFTIGVKGLQHIQRQHLVDDVFLVESGIETGILESNFTLTQTILLRAKILDQIGGFNILLSGPEDLEFCWRAAVLGARFAYIDYPLIERHVHSDSLTAQGDKIWMARLEAVEVMYQTCRKLGREDLQKHVRATELRTYHNLLRIYGERGQRGRIFRAYIESTRRGVSPRTLVWFLAALVGPRALAQILRMRKG